MTNINKLLTNLSIVSEELNKFDINRALHTIADRLEDAVWEIEHDHHQPKLAEQIESKVSEITADYYNLLKTVRQSELLLADLTKQIARNTDLYNLLVLSYKAYDAGYIEEAEMHSLDFVKSCEQQLAKDILEDFCNDFDFDGNTTSTNWLNFHYCLTKGE